MKLKIISQNLLDVPYLFPWKIRIEILLKKMKKIDPDIIFFQEVIFPSTYEEIKKVFKGYHFYRRGAKSLLIATKVRGRKYKYTTYKKQFYWHPLSLSDKWAKKGFQSLEIESEGKKVTLFNTHLLAAYTHYRSLNEKRVIKSQLRQFAKFIRRTRGRVIVGGDFNLPKINELYRYFLKQSKLINPLEKVRAATFNRKIYPKFYRSFLPGKYQIDYIFEKGFKPKNIFEKLIFKRPIKYAKDKKTYLSDHYGLFSTANVVQ